MRECRSMPELKMKCSGVLEEWDNAPARLGWNQSMQKNKNPFSSMAFYMFYWFGSNIPSWNEIPVKCLFVRISMQCMYAAHVICENGVLKKAKKKRLNLYICNWVTVRMSKLLQTCTQKRRVQISKTIAAPTKPNRMKWCKV